MKNTKFWLAVGVLVSMVVIVLIYLLKTDKLEVGIIALPFGVITLVAGSFFTANAAITRSALSNGKAPPMEKTEQ